MPAGLPFRARFTERIEFAEAEKAAFTDNFRVAVDKACAEGLSGTSRSVDRTPTRRTLLFVLNAPEANVTSIYFGPSAAPPAMLSWKRPFGDSAANPLRRGPPRSDLLRDEGRDTRGEKSARPLPPRLSAA